MSAASQNASATTAFNTVFASAIESEEPTILNSNLLFVKANGEVLFLSVTSASITGTLDTPVSILVPLKCADATPFSII